MKDETLRTALQIHAGTQVDDGSKGTFCDLALFCALEDLPSLGPFLLKGHLRANILSVHYACLEIINGEFIETGDFFISRFRPMGEMAFDGLEQAYTLSQLRKFVVKM